MRILYIYPHPDDESFGPAHVMSKQRREGHEVFLLTLTKGGATRQRFKYNYSVEEMGEVRYKEMLDVARVLDLTDMTVLNLPDSGLAEMDPREIESVVAVHIERVQPDAVVTYPVHGISGFFDHIITHGIVKRVYLELRERHRWLKRLAFSTITEEEASAKEGMFHLTGSKDESIDCIVTVSDEDVRKSHAALDCYVTFQETIEQSRIKEFIGNKAVFEFFKEDFNPPVTDMFEGLEK